MKQIKKKMPRKETILEGKDIVAHAKEAFMQVKMLKKKI